MNLASELVALGLEGTRITILQALGAVSAPVTALFGEVENQVRSEMRAIDGCVRQELGFDSR